MYISTSNSVNVSTRFFWFDSVNRSMDACTLIHSTYRMMSFPGHCVLYQRVPTVTFIMKYCFTSAIQQRKWYIHFYCFVLWWNKKKNAHTQSHTHTQRRSPFCPISLSGIRFIYKNVSLRGKYTPKRHQLPVTITIWFYSYCVPFYLRNQYSLDSHGKIVINGIHIFWMICL